MSTLTAPEPLIKGTQSQGSEREYASASSEYRSRLVSPLVLPDLEKISPIEAIGGIPPDVPVLILAGDEDPVARPAEAQAILDRVRSHGRLVLFKHAGHMNFPETYPDLYQQSVLAFLREINMMIGDLM
jgi:pimeloyl-ACP methyl ester carboxylesterase